MSDTATPVPRPRRRWVLPTVIVVTAVVTFAVTAILVNIFERKSESRATYAEVVQLDENTVDPAVWGRNFPVQYQAYLKTADFTPTTHNKALVPVQQVEATTPTGEKVSADTRKETTASKLTEDPRLVTMWKGYAFAIDYRHLRGHSYMLEDQINTQRVKQKQQPGACLNCHASTVKIMNDLGNGDTMAGFAAMNKMPYQEAASHATNAVSCIDCHDPKTMELRITRPALIEGLKNLKASQGIKNYDVNKDATNSEMRSYVCAQCHVEYYFAGDDKTLTFPWNKGTDINDVFEYYQEVGFTDWEHKETGAKVLKAQHPEFETWSAGVHAANGVSCADCHMAYTRDGASKVSNHDVTSPMTNVNGTCGTCHTKSSEDALKNRVTTIQNRFVDSRDRSLDALNALINDIVKAKADGTAKEQIDLALEYQNKASFYVDYAYSENSYGFHAPDYMQRILSQSLDASRKGQLALRGSTAAELEPSDTAKANATQTKQDGKY